MSIATEIERIKAAKEALKTAINARGGTLADELLDQYPAAVTALPESEDIDLSFITATANDILAGKVGADVNGNPVNGNIQTVTASRNDNVVTVPKGYIASEQTLTVAEMAEPSVSENAVTIFKGYLSEQTTVEVSKATATLSANIVTIPAGYHDANTLTVAEAGDVSVSANVVTIPVGYIKSQRTVTVGTAKGAETFTPSTTDQTIAADTYLSGVQTIKGDANLLAENIAEGVSIFGIAGTHQGGGGGEMEFYKCASVDTSAKTWDGYKALFDGEYYSFSDALTTGMTYSDIVPKTGSIYTADLLVTVSYLHMGTPAPVFAESFAGYLHNDFTQYATAPSFQTIEGRQCMVCDYSHRLSIIDSNLPSGNAPRTLTAWIHYTQSGGEWQFFCGYGGPDLETFYIATRYNELMCYQAVEHPYDPWVELSEGWHHIALSFDGTKVIGYVDGAEVGYSTCSFDTDIVNYPLAVGYLGTMSSSYSTGGYISNLEVYDKALAAEEIVFIYQMQSI